jgi:hypothetical protein
MDNIGDGILLGHRNILIGGPTLAAASVIGTATQVVHAQTAATLNPQPLPPCHCRKGALPQSDQ